MSWHDCEECGQACYCDFDDTEMPIDDSEPCSHRCDEDEDEFDLPDGDDS